MKSLLASAYLGRTKLGTATDVSTLHTQYVKVQQHDRQDVPAFVPYAVTVSPDEV